MMTSRRRFIVQCLSGLALAQGAAAATDPNVSCLVNVNSLRIKVAGELPLRNVATFDVLLNDLRVVYAVTRNRKEIVIEEMSKSSISIPFSLLQRMEYKNPPVTLTARLWAAATPIEGGVPVAGSPKDLIFPNPAGGEPFFKLRITPTYTRVQLTRLLNIVIAQI